MTYGYDTYAYSNKAGTVRIAIDGYKTKTGVKKALKRRLENSKIILTGWVLYSFVGGEEMKYSANGYEILDQYNHKAFFEYWR